MTIKRLLTHFFPATLALFAGATMIHATQVAVTPASLSFKYQLGTFLPPSQDVSVVSATGANSPYTVSATTSNGGNWLILARLTTVTPFTFVVAMSPLGLPVGTYNGIVSVSPAGVTAPVAQIPVTLTVTDVSILVTDKTSINFNYQAGGAPLAGRALTVTSTGAPISFSTAVAGTPWITASTSATRITTPGVLSVNAQVPAGIAPGTYTATVTLIPIAGGPSATVDVSVQVSSASTQSFSANSSFTSTPVALSFSYQVGQGSIPFKAAVITSPGSSQTFTLGATTSSGGAWLSTAGGETTPAAILVAVNTKGLTPGTYTGAVNILPTDPTAQPLQIPVILNVASGPVLQTSANQLGFEYQIGQAAPAAQQVNVTSSGAPLAYASTAITANGGNWLLTVSTGTATTPSSVTVSVNPAGLVAGTYYGTVIINDTAGNSPAAYVPVTLQVSGSPILTVPSQFLTFSATIGGGATAPQTINVGSNVSGTAFHVDTLGGGWLTAAPTDGATDGVISVTAVPGNLATGYYLGLVSISIPGTPGSQELVPVVFLVLPGIQFPSPTPGP